MSKNNHIKNFKINKGLYLIDIDKYINKSKKFLWEKKQKNMFFTWVFTFLAIMTIILCLNVAILLGQIIDKAKIVDFYTSISTVGSGERNWSMELVYTIFDILISLVVVVNLVLSIIKCINLKSLKFISFLSTIFVFIKMFYGFIGLIGFIINGSINNSVLIKQFETSWTYILAFIMPFLYVLIWFFVSRNVSLIRNIFIRVETKEIFLQQQKDGNNNNPFASNNFFEADNNNETKTNVDVKENNPFYKRLKNLSKEQIHEMAQALSISGYETMTEKEIIDIIYEIKSSQEKTSKEFEVESESDKDKK